VLVTGDFGGVLDFGGNPLVSMGASDIFLAKFDSGAHILWSKRFGDASAQQSYGIAVDTTDNVLISGSFAGSVDFGTGPLASAGDSDIFLAKFDATGSALIGKRLGDSAPQHGRAVAAGALGDMAITGHFQGYTDFGGGTLVAGTPNVFVAAYDSSGQHEWSKQSGVTVDQHVEGITADALDHACVLGSFDGVINLGAGPLVTKGGLDVYIASLDEFGLPIWAKSFGDPSFQAGGAIARDGLGDVLVTGSFASSIDFGGGALTSAGFTDIYLAKLDLAGNHVFSKRFGDAVDQRGEGIAVDPADNVLLTGYFIGTVDFGGGLLASTGGTDVFVAKFDSMGGHLFSKNFGDMNNQRATSIATDSSGAILITGSLIGTADFGGGVIASAGGSDIFVVKLDAAGNHIFSKRYGDGTDQFGESIAVDGSDNVLVTGRFNGTVDFGSGLLTSAGGNDVFVVKLDPGGNAVFSVRAGDGGDQRGESVAASSSGDVLVTGRFAGALDFGGGPLVSAGAFDVFVAKLSPTGSLLWRTRAGDKNDQVGLAIAFGGAGTGFVGGDFYGSIDWGNSAGSNLLIAGTVGSDGFFAHFGP
jgi:hypothetical protein